MQILKMILIAMALANTSYAQEKVTCEQERKAYDKTKEDVVKEQTEKIIKAVAQDEMAGMCDFIRKSRAEFQAMPKKFAVNDLGQKQAQAREEFSKNLKDRTDRWLAALKAEIGPHAHILGRDTKLDGTGTPKIGIKVEKSASIVMAYTYGFCPDRNKPAKLENTASILTLVNVDQRTELEIHAFPTKYTKEVSLSEGCWSQEFKQQYGDKMKDVKGFIKLMNPSLETQGQGSASGQTQM